MPTDEDLSTLHQLKQAFAGEVPSGSAIAQTAIRHALSHKKANAKWVKKNFSSLVESIQLDAYERYLKAEKLGWQIAFSTVFGPLLSQCSTPEELAAVISDNFYALDKFFLSRTQSRRVRAGKAFETVIREFFWLLDYPFTPQPRIDGNPDFVLPSIDQYREDPLNVIVFTVKRSLRERWRQIVTEGAKGLGFYLATIDEQVPAVDLRAMQKQKIFLVVPVRLKEDIEHYQTAKNVITFEEFFLSYLDPAMIRWKRTRRDLEST